MVKVLTIEDDPVVAREIVEELTKCGFEVEWVSNGHDGIARAMSNEFDVITLDRILPKVDGLTIVTTMRSVGIETPVLMISTLSDVDERVRGLRAGGDDYLTKPFAMDEMAVRLEVLLRRRTHASEPRETVLRVGPLELDLVTRSAKCGDGNLNLLPTEFRLLELFMKHAGQTLTRTIIFETIWGMHFDPGTNLIDVHVGRLRRKIEANGTLSLLRTVRGSGYVLGE